MIVLNKMYMNGDTSHQNETLIKLAEKISIEIDSSDTTKVQIGKVPTLISWSCFQTVFRSLVSKLIYSWKNKAFSFKEERLILKTERIFLHYNMLLTSV